MSDRGHPPSPCPSPNGKADVCIQHRACSKARTNALTDANGEIICYCNDLHTAEVEKTIRVNGLTRIAEVTAITHQDDPCALCAKRIELLLARVNQEASFVRALMQPDHGASIAMVKVGRA